jgi:MFS family permease
MRYDDRCGPVKRGLGVRVPDRPPTAAAGDAASGVGATAFVLTSAACAVASASWLLIGFRALQGAAAALVIPQTIGLIQEVRVHHIAEPRGEGSTSASSRGRSLSVAMWSKLWSVVSTVASFAMA